MVPPGEHGPLPDDLAREAIDGHVSRIDDDISAELGLEVDAEDIAALGARQPFVGGRVLVADPAQEGQRFPVEVGRVPRSLEAGDVKIDAMEPVILRNNFFEDQSGWGLDMDDGASNYEIYNNISKGISIKLREGAYRNVYNNIWVESNVAPCFHVGNEDNHDRYYRNITVMARDDVYSIIAPPARRPWLKEIDNNCLFSRSGRFTARISQMRGENGPERGSRRLDFEEWRKLGFDRNSVFADPLFVDPAKNDYRVRPGSPALRVGFNNFEMGQWGITKEFPRELR